MLATEIKRLCPEGCWHCLHLQTRHHCSLAKWQKSSKHKIDKEINKKYNKYSCQKAADLLQITTYYWITNQRHVCILYLFLHQYVWSVVLQMLVYKSQKYCKILLSSCHTDKGEKGEEMQPEEDRGKKEMWATKTEWGNKRKEPQRRVFKKKKEKVAERQCGKEVKQTKGRTRGGSVSCEAVSRLFVNY